MGHSAHPPPPQRPTLELRRRWRWWPGPHPTAGPWRAVGEISAAPRGVPALSCPAAFPLATTARAVRTPRGGALTYFVPCCRNRGLRPAALSGALPSWAGGRAGRWGRPSQLPLPGDDRKLAGGGGCEEEEAGGGAGCGGSRCGGRAGDAALRSRRKRPGAGAAARSHAGPGALSRPRRPPRPPPCRTMEEERWVRAPSLCVRRGSSGYAVPARRDAGWGCRAPGRSPWLCAGMRDAACGDPSSSFLPACRYTFCDERLPCCY